MQPTRGLRVIWNVVRVPTARALPGTLPRTADAWRWAAGKRLLHSVVLPVIGVVLRRPCGAPRMLPATPDNYSSYGLWNSYSAFGGMAKPDAIGRGGRNTV